jgi:ankyrin repeat protein
MSLLNVEDANGHSALQLAVIAGNETIVSFLLKLSADVRSRDNELRTAVHWAARTYTSW